MSSKPAGCLIEPDRVSELGAPVVGIVERLHVERGERVVSGQPVISLRSAVESANANVATTRSRMDADIRASQASLDLAKQKVRRAEKLVLDNFISAQALEQALAEQELAVQKLAQARGQQQVWDGERRVAEAQVGLRVVRSPFAGVVVERYVNLGERVEEKPLLRVAVINPLRVELMVSTLQYGSVALGDSITVRPELPGAQPVVAKVVHIDRVMDAASNTFRVRLSLPNPNDELPAGLRCKADLPAVAAARAASGVTPLPAAAAKPAAISRLPFAAATDPPAKPLARERAAATADKATPSPISAVVAAPAVEAAPARMPVEVAIAAGSHSPGKAPAAATAAPAKPAKAAVSVPKTANAPATAGSTVAAPLSPAARAARHAALVAATADQPPAEPPVTVHRSSTAPAASPAALIDSAPTSSGALRADVR